jgi:feruloyl esterase
MNPNLQAFFTHGGKLIQYHGWNDQQISALNSVNYFKSVQERSRGAGSTNDAANFSCQAP